MLTGAACTTTISILEALVFGSDGACIDLSLASILPAVLAFMAAVVVLKIAGKALLVRIAAGLRSAPPTDTDEARGDRGLIGTAGYDGGPIRSTRRR